MELLAASSGVTIDTSSLGGSTIAGRASGWSSSTLGSAYYSVSRCPPHVIDVASVAARYHEGDGAEWTGPWTADEHQEFLKCLDIFGEPIFVLEWNKFAERIKTRSVAQIRSYAREHFQQIEGAEGAAAASPEFAQIPAASLEFAPAPDVVEPAGRRQSRRAGAECSSACRHRKSSVIDDAAPETAEAPKKGLLRRLRRELRAGADTGATTGHARRAGGQLSYLLRKAVRGRDGL